MYQNLYGDEDASEEPMSHEPHPMIIGLLLICLGGSLLSLDIMLWLVITKYSDIEPSSIDLAFDLSASLISVGALIAVSGTAWRFFNPPPQYVLPDSRFIGQTLNDLEKHFASPAA